MGLRGIAEALVEGPGRFKRTIRLGPLRGGGRPPINVVTHVRPVLLDEALRLGLLSARFAEPERDWVSGEQVITVHGWQANHRERSVNGSALSRAAGVDHLGQPRGTRLARLSAGRIVREPAAFDDLLEVHQESLLCTSW